MVNGSWLVAQGSWLPPQGSWLKAKKKLALGPSGSGPWAMSQEPLTINNRLIHELLDYIL